MSLAAPLVSIITPVYNGGVYLEKLIQSVRAQDYPLCEHLLIDDGSTDGGATTTVLASFPHTRWWSRENKGQYATLNEGLIAANGDWVCFISADDLMEPEAVSAVMTYSEQHSEAEVIYGKTQFIREDGSRHPVQTWPERVSPKWFPYLMGIYHCSLYVRRSKLLEKGLFFDENLKFSGDFDWIMRLIRSGMKFGYLDRTLSSLRTHPQRASIVHKKAQDQELEMLQERYGVRRWLFTVLSLALYTRSAGLETLSMLKNRELALLADRIRSWFKHRIERG